MVFGPLLTVETQEEQPGFGQALRRADLLPRISLLVARPAVSDFLTHFTHSAWDGNEGVTGKVEDRDSESCI